MRAKGRRIVTGMAATLGGGLFGAWMMNEFQYIASEVAQTATEAVRPLAA